MVRQSRLEHKRFFHRFWRDMGKGFPIMLVLGVVIVLAMPLFRFEPLAYMFVFFFAFGVNWVQMFRRRERHRFFEEGDD